MYLSLRTHHSPLHSVLALLGIIASTLFLGAPRPATACSVFMLKGTKCATVGRNYDWDTGNGILITNKRDMSMTALGLNNPAQWTSKYGSVTFNQYGRGFPCGGMNEKGLVIEVLWLDGSQYPQPDDRPMVSTLQWIQYQLDTAANVDEVLASDKRLRIESISGTQVHFFVADRSGTAATIEFIDGKMVAHYGNSLPIAALTNSTYATSIQKLREESEESIEANAIPYCDGSSLGRFVCAGCMATRYAHTQRGTDPVDYCFGVLQHVKQGGFTQWSVVYDTEHHRIHFKTQKANQLRFIDLDDVDFSNATPAMILDLEDNLSGNIIAEMAPYTSQQNRAVLTKSIQSSPILAHLPKAILENVARYPESIHPTKGAQQSKPSLVPIHVK